LTIARLSHGVLEVITSSGSHYLNPTIFERLQLIWMFRHFRILPLNVLNERGQRAIEVMASNRGYVPPEHRDEILGTIDCRPMGKKLPRSVAVPQETLNLRARTTN
jgi:hypothetical protein